MRIWRWRWGRAVLRVRYWLTGEQRWVSGGPVTRITLRPASGNFRPGTRVTLTYEWPERVDEEGCRD